MNRDPVLRAAAAEFFYPVSSDVEGRAFSEAPIYEFCFFRLPKKWSAELSVRLIPRYL